MLLLAYRFLHRNFINLIVNGIQCKSYLFDILNNQFKLNNRQQFKRIKIDEIT
jgi:hypothetical protein